LASVVPYVHNISYFGVI